MPRSTFTNHKIRTIESLREWILISLGSPLITIELTESQLDLAIDEAFELYTKYAQFNEKYLALNLTEYDTVNNYFNLSGYNIAAVYGIDTQGGSMFGAGGDTIFTISNAMLQSGSYPFFGGMGAGGAWVTFHAAHEFMELTKRMMGSGYEFDFDRFNKTLTLIPKPAVTSGYILIACECIPPDEELYGNEYLKRIALAKAKIMLGTIRKKFGGIQLVGGGQIDSEIGSEGKEELDKIIDNIRKDEAMGTGFFLG
jgi:hypothetical protein